jgi:hypothetical protein
VTRRNELGERMVEWLGPTGLVVTGVNVVLSGVFGRYADKRELEGAIKREDPIRYTDDEDLWIDYVADSGDGWSSTYAVAWLLCQDHAVRVDGRDETTHPGRVLVLGGDQVYPTADYGRYERRLTRPYSIAARQLPATDRPRDVLAIPGNHDWYDGLTSFMRIFGRGHAFAAWRAPQARSYFAAQLRDRWWLLGIDIAFDSYLDVAQLAYFRDLKGDGETNIRRGDRVILCTAKPTWSERCMEGDLRTVRHADSTLLGDLENEILHDWGCEIPLMLSGDLHHYSRYRTEDRSRHLVTAGGGGAYLLPTHGLADDLPCPASHPHDGRHFVLDGVYPTKEDSSGLRRRIVLGPFSNRSFLVLIGVLDVIIASQARGGVQKANASILQSLAGISWATVLAKIFARPLSGLLAIVLLLALAGFADAGSRGNRAFMAGAHWIVHVAAAVTAMWAAVLVTTHALHLCETCLTSALRTVAAFVIMIGLTFLFGLLIGGLVFGGYLFVSERTGRHANDAFAALHLTSYKNFVRMKLARDGSLWVFPFGVDGVKEWRPKIGDDASGAPMVPPGPPQAHLIHDPIHIEGRR